MPFCSRRTWKTPSGFTTWPTPGCYDEGVVLPRFQSDIQTGRRRVFIMTTIQTQRPTLVYVACFYPDITAVAGLLLSRHSHQVGGVLRLRDDAPRGERSLRPFRSGRPPRRGGRISSRPTTRTYPSTPSRRTAAANSVA